MRQPNVDDNVRLTHDLPNLQLAAGSVGVICSMWFAPECSYEVEFHGLACDGDTRVLLRVDDVEVLEEAETVLDLPE